MAMQVPEVCSLCVSASCECSAEARHVDARISPVLLVSMSGGNPHKLTKEYEESEDGSTVCGSPKIAGTRYMNDPGFHSQSSCESEVQQVGWEVPTLPACTEVATQMAQVAKQVRPWSSSGLEFVASLQDARKNHGTVDLMQSLNNGSFVVAKRMPNWWMAMDDESQKQHSNSAERPWLDIGVIKYLESRNYPFLCKTHGVFRGAHFTYVISSFAEHGDLFKWCIQGPLPGPEREHALRPVVCQLLHAVQMLHNLGIAHRDLSLENVLLTGGQDFLQIKIIDFSMATCSRQCCNEPFGKKTYKAPETLVVDKPYDTFLADSFALGVALFAMGAQDYPWFSTAKGGCKMFDYTVKHGLKAYLVAKKVRKGNGERLNHVFSKEFVELLEGLLCMDPDGRLTLGEQCWSAGLSRLRTSVWDMRWLHVHA